MDQAFPDAVRMMVRVDDSGKRSVSGPQHHPDDQVVVQKQVCLIGHLFVHHLRQYIDDSPVLDRHFGLDSVSVAWLGMNPMGRDYLCSSALDHVLDNCPDIVVLQAIDNDLDVDGPINRIVEDHMFFAMDLATLMGGIKVVIGAPLHRRSPRHLSSQACNANVNEDITLLRQLLVDPAFASTKHLDMRAFRIQKVVHWDHRKLKGMSQLGGDGVHLTGVGYAYLYHSNKTIIHQLAK